MQPSIDYLLFHQAVEQDISKAVSPPPLTLTHCFVDGKFHFGRYCIYKRRRVEQDKASVMCCKNYKKEDIVSMTFCYQRRNRIIIPDQ